MATKHVMQKYFLLHARRITFRSLNFHLFFGRIVSESHLVSHNIRREKENKYLHRFIIYISFFFQCLLNNASELMSKFNLKLEHWLNDDKGTCSRFFNANLWRLFSFYSLNLSHINYPLMRKSNFIE